MKPVEQHSRALIYGETLKHGTGPLYCGTELEKEEKWFYRFVSLSCLNSALKQRSTLGGTDLCPAVCVIVRRSLWRQYRRRLMGVGGVRKKREGDWLPRVMSKRCRISMITLNPQHPSAWLGLIECSMSQNSSELKHGLCAPSWTRTAIYSLL